MGGRRTFNSVPFIRGTNVDNISSTAAGWKNLRTLSAIYPMYHDIWLQHTGLDLRTSLKTRVNIPDFKLPSAEEEIVVKNIE